MSARRYCPHCQRPLKTCLCDVLVELNCHYHLVILQDPTEAKHPLSSSPILEKSVRGAQRVVGEIFEPEEILGSNWKHNSLLIFPSELAISATQARRQTFKNLILLDGTWRKATRLLHSNQWLHQLPCIAIDAQHASQYKIRKSPRADGLSTIEAAVYVLNALHDEQDFNPILNAFEKMIRLQITAMGETTFNKNYNH